MKTLVLSLIVTICSGCAAVPRSTIERVDFGTPPTKKSIEAIKLHFEHRLEDPSSAEYNFCKPHRAYLKGEWLHAGKAGYAVRLNVNGKRSGTYTGYEAYTFLIRNDEVIQWYEGTDISALHRVE